MDDSGTRLTTMANRAEGDAPKAVRIGWLVPDKLNAPSTAPSKTYTLRLPAGCSAGAKAALTELHMFTRASLAPFDASGGLMDDHFHPCSFSHYCSNLTDIVAEQQRQGVVGAMLYGLQHNLLKVRPESPAARCRARTNQQRPDALARAAAA